MLRERASGILLHPTSLPGPWGIGDLGPAAFAFLDFLQQAGQRVWQVLPLGPTGYGDSPYQSFSAFAGNPLLIALDEKPRLPLAEDHVHFEAVIPEKTAALKRAVSTFVETPAYEAFLAAEAWWLEDFALFMALKHHFGEQRIWTEWPTDIRSREEASLVRYRAQLGPEIRLHKVLQFLFFSQFQALRDAARARGIRIMGDLPIYVAHDSADVWANPHLFELDQDGNPTWISGVPPDYFSATGQLWGNPIYRWPAHQESSFSWWISRLRASLAMFDIVRLDHFRGFEAYWAVRGGSTTAIDGEWRKAPGLQLFEAAEQALGKLPLIAENLGVITPEVEALRKRFGLPGMAILQFAFGTDPQAPDFKPHNYPRDLVAYTGTHDNDTTVGWYSSADAGKSTRSRQEIEEEREHCRAYLNTQGIEIHWDFIRAVMSSVADLCLIPVQDVLGCGGFARMNIPAVLGGNWRWRMLPDQLQPKHAKRLKEMVMLYDR